MSRNVIKNKIVVLGKDNEIQKVMEGLKRNNLDFNKILPVGDLSNDIEMDDYMCVCLNLYMEKYAEDKKTFYDACLFVGRTRNVPYNFNAMERKKICTIKSNNKIKSMLKDAKLYLEKVKDKSIYNGYIIRDTFWGTGSNAVNIVFAKNSITFNTYYTAPLKVIAEISRKNPNAIIQYSFKNGNKENEYIYQNGECNVLKDENAGMPDSFGLISLHSRI